METAGLAVRIHVVEHGHTIQRHDERRFEASSGRFVSQEVDKPPVMSFSMPPRRKSMDSVTRVAHRASRYRFRPRAIRLEMTGRGAETTLPGERVVLSSVPRADEEPVQNLPLGERAAHMRTAVVNRAIPAAAMTEDDRAPVDLAALETTFGNFVRGGDQSPVQALRHDLRSLTRRSIGCNHGSC